MIVCWIWKILDAKEKTWIMRRKDDIPLCIYNIACSVIRISYKIDGIKGDLEIWIGF